MRVKFGSDTDKRPGARRDDLRDRAVSKIAEQGLPRKADRSLVPVCPSLMVSSGSSTCSQSSPAALGARRRKIVGVGGADARVFAATSTLSVALALALMTWNVRARRGDSCERCHEVPPELDPRCPEGPLPTDHPARERRPVHAPDQPLRPSLRRHARRAPCDPHLHRAHLPRRDAVDLPRFLVLLSVLFLSVRSRDRRFDPGVHFRRPVSITSAAIKAEH